MEEDFKAVCDGPEPKEVRIAVGVVPLEEKVKLLEEKVEQLQMANTKPVPWKYEFEGGKRQGTSHWTWEQYKHYLAIREKWDKRRDELSKEAARKIAVEVQSGRNQDIIALFEKSDPEFAWMFQNENRDIKEKDDVNDSLLFVCVDAFREEETRKRVAEIDVSSLMRLLFTS